MATSRRSRDRKVIDLKREQAAQAAPPVPTVNLEADEPIDEHGRVLAGDTFARDDELDTTISARFQRVAQRC